MRLALKIVTGLVATALIVAAVGAFVVTNTHWGHEKLRTRVVSMLNNPAHRVVRIDSISGNLLHGVTLHGVSITDSAGAPFITAAEMQTAYTLLPFLKRKVDLSDVRFVRPEIVIDKAPTGVWNYDRIFPTDSTSPKADTAGVQFGDWVVFHRVELVDGHLTVRLPWHAADSLTPRLRDGVTRAALNGGIRLKVVRAPGGYQQVHEFQRIYATLPLARISHPDFSTRLFTVDSAHLTALAFLPPAVDVHQLVGKFEVNRDSVWFDVSDLQLPASRTVTTGRYTIDNGDLALHMVGKPVALADARFLIPALPSEGSATFDLVLNWANHKEQYVLHNLDLKTGNSTANGDVGITMGDTVELHQTNIRFAGIHTRLIKQLMPALEIPREGMLSGRAKVDGTIIAMQVDGDVTFIDSRTGLNRVIAAGGLGSSNGVFRARNLHVTLAPMQTRMVESTMKDFPLQGTVSGSALLNGATNTRLTATKLDLTHLDRGERSRVTGTGAVRLADGSKGSVPYLFLDAVAEPLSLVTVGRFAPAAGLRGTVAGPIRIDGTTKDLAVNATMRSSDGGSIAAVGRLDVASDEIGYSLDVNTLLFNANVLAEKAPRTSLSAMLSARGRGFEPATMQSDIDASLSTSTIDTLALDSSRVRVRIASGMAVVDTFVLHVPGAAANIAGEFGMAKTASGTLTYRVQIDSVGKLARYLPFDTSIVTPRPGPVAERLAALRADSIRIAERMMVARAAGVAAPGEPVVIDTPPSFRRDSLSGAAAAEGSATGSIESFDLKGIARATGIIALGNTVQHARFAYTWKGAMTPQSLFDLTANADSVSAAGFAMDSVAASATYTNPGGIARIGIFQNDRRDYSMNAAYAIYPDRRELKFESLRFRFDTTRWASVHPGSILWGQPGIEIDSVDLRNAAGGRIFADGKLPSEGVVDLNVAIEKFEVGDLMGLLQSDLALRGLFSTELRMTGNSASPLLAGKANVANASYGGTAIPEVNSSFNYAGERLAAKADATYQGRSIASAAGSVAVNLATSGVTGSRLLDAPSSVDVKADSLPLDLASKFTDVVSEVRGFAIGQAALRGNIRKPEITGDVVVANASMRVTSLGVKLQSMNGSVHVRGDSVVIDSVTATSGGRISIKGGLGIADLAAPSFDLHLAADGARVLDSREQGRVRADATIDVVGPYNGVLVSGKARIREGVIYIPKSDTREQLAATDGVIYEVADTTGGQLAGLLPTQSPLLNNLRMDLTLAVDRDVWVRNTEANVEIFSDGDLRINLDRKRGKLTLDGVVSTDRGEYEFLSKRFQLKRGTATFVGTQEINPSLQFTGEYELKQASQQALKIRVLIGGTLLSPKLTLESDAQPPISQSDLLSYLAFGSESGSLLQFGGSSVSGGTAGGGLVGTSAALATKQLAGVALGVVVDQVEGQAARSLGADVFNITPSNIPPEIASGNLTFLKGTQFEFGKYFNTQTFVGLQLQAKAPPGFRIEHRFGERGLSLESTLQPRYFLAEPSLAPLELKKANAFGLFFIKRWKY